MSTTKLRMKHGCLGYGIYALLTEMLESEHSHRLTKDYADIAYILREDADIIRSVVEDFGLFADMGDCFTTHYHQRIIAARIEAGRKGGKISKRKQTQAKCTFAYPTPQNIPDLEGKNKQNTDLLITNESTDNTLSISDLHSVNPPSEASTDKQTEAKQHFAYFAYSDTAKEEKEKKQKNKEETSPPKEKTLYRESKKENPPWKVQKAEENKADVYRLSPDWVEIICMNNKMSITDFRIYMEEFTRIIQNRDELKTLADFKSHFASWLQIQLDHIKAKNNGRNNKQADAERRQSQIIAQVAELDRKFLAGQTQ